MKREIKFRTWDTERKMFVPQGEIVFRDYGDTSIEVHPNDPSYVGDSCHNGEPQRGRFEVMQFTGLTDKNGKEIYEGDILRTETDKPMVVSWNKKYASFYLNRDGWAFSHYFGEAADPERVEIIGNIYENPELLKI